MPTPVITWTVQTPQQARRRLAARVGAAVAGLAAAALLIPSPLYLADDQPHTTHAGQHARQHP